MKIAVTSTGKNPDSEIDPRFGRATYFIIMDTETSDFSAIENTQSGTGGAGIAAAGLVSDAGAEAVLTGNCGPKAQQTLNAAGVILYTGVSGKVTDAIELFKKSKLIPAEGPNVESNFGTDK